MTAWPFVIVAYGVAIGLTLALLIWAFVSMRRAERVAQGLARR